MLLWQMGTSLSTRQCKTSHIMPLLAKCTYPPLLAMFKKEVNANEVEASVAPLSWTCSLGRLILGCLKKTTAPSLVKSYPSCQYAHAQKQT